MKIAGVIIALLVPAGSAFADLQIDSFDDISSWSVWPSGSMTQGTAPGDPVVKGTGSLIADYTPNAHGDNRYINKFVSLDLSPATIGAADAAISLWMWIGKDTLTARLDTLTFETSYLNSFSYDPAPWNYTLPTGWHHIVVDQADFVVTGSPDWSNITNIKIDTTSYNTASPTDVAFDDLRLIETAPPPPPPSSDTIESFDNIASLNLNVWPDKGWLVQDNQKFVEGTGALVIEYQANYPADPTENFYVSWNLGVVKDLRPETIGADAAAISFWIWIGKTSQTTRLLGIKIATQQYSSEFEYQLDWHKIYPIGWNQVVIPLSAFIDSSTTTVAPDWSSITWIQFNTTCFPDTTPTDFRFDDLRLIEYIPPPPLVPPGVGQIDSFDDISDWSVSPPGVVVQGTTADGDPVKEGAGSLIADYTPFGSDSYTFSKDVDLNIHLDLAAETDAIANLSMWVGKTSETARMDYLAFETSPGNQYRYDVSAVGTTYPVGWNQLYIPLSAFTSVGNPDWSNITQIEFATTSDPDTQPTNVLFDNLRVIEHTPLSPGVIETFDAVSCMNVNPDKGWDVREAQSHIEGSGALRMAYAANYAADPTDDFQISWFTPAPLDLRPSTIGAAEASISLWIWVGKAIPTSRVTSIRFASDYDNHEFEYIIPQEIYQTGWNHVIVPQSQFTSMGSPDWSAINWIAINTISTPDTQPTDLIIDNLRLVENKCNLHDLNSDCAYNLIDFALAARCWQADCVADPGDSCCELDLAPVVSDLRCEYQETPLGIDTTQPRFSWKISSNARGVLQSAYHILVASSQANLDANLGDMWDSEKVSSNRSIQVPYAGKALQSEDRYYWKVRCWDQNGQLSDYSDPTWFDMGLLHPQDWTGNWIGGNDLVRREFTINKTVQQARAFISGVGYYALRLNGAKVGDHVLDPGWTKYDKTTLYATYDVTGHLQNGQNAIGVMLGNGYYSWSPNFYLPRVILQLNIDFTDGTRMSVVSDGAWKTASGPIVENHIFDGESYDARLEKPGWDLANYNESGWSSAQILASPTEKLASQLLEPIRVIQTITPVSIANPLAGVYVFDLGQNIAGWARLNVTGPAGTTVTLKFGELLDGNGRVDQTNIIQSAEATDVYILKGSGVEVWEPRFTYHGFRYVEMTGFPGVPSINALEGRVVHSDVSWAGSFSCSNSLINQIQQNVHWGLRDNFHSLPTSACQRGERGAWGGDSQVMAETACYNFGMGPFYSKWLNDFKDDQRQDGGVWDVTPWDGWGGFGAPGWHDCYFKIAETMYVRYGDTRVIEEQMEGMRKALDFILDSNRDLIWENRVGGSYGDWGSPVNDDEHKALLATCNLYRATLFMSQMSAAIDRPSEAQSYANLADQIVAALNTRFFNTGTSQYAGGAQAANAFPLFLGIVPAGHETTVANNLVNNVVNNNNMHLTTGCQGTRYVPLALAMSGHADVAYGLATQTTGPSWGYMIANGATTLWEFWQGGNQISHNHPFLGSISEWFYEVLAGIDVDPTGPGYEKITIKPHIVGDLTWVQGSVDTIRGKVISDWTKSGNTLTLNVTLPGNSTAKVHVPKDGLSNVTVTEGGTTIWQNSSFIAGVAGITTGTENNEHVIFDVGSGSYIFVLNGI